MSGLLVPFPGRWEMKWGSEPHPGGGRDFPHVTDEETEAQRREATCLKSQSWKEKAA